MEKKINKRYQTVYVFEEGGISEYARMFIRKDEPIDEDSHPCRHTQNGITPYAVMIKNEGGYSVTLACAECISEALEEIRKENDCKSDRNYS